MLASESNIELDLEILVQESSQSNYVSRATCSLCQGPSKEDRQLLGQK